jgi:hypothetical protein
MGSGKSLLKSPASSWASACRAITWYLVSENKAPRGFHFTFKCLLNIDRLLCARLKVWDAAFGLAESHRSLR